MEPTTWFSDTCDVTPAWGSRGTRPREKPQRSRATDTFALVTPMQRRMARRLVIAGLLLQRHQDRQQVLALRQRPQRLAEDGTEGALRIVGLHRVAGPLGGGEQVA